MSNRETARNIDDAAADWAAKLDRGLSESEKDDLQVWLCMDSRRVGALARARAVWSHAASRLAQDGGRPELEIPPLLPRLFTRRRLLAGGCAIAASVALVPILRNRPQLLSSEVGEVRRIGLEDGSTITLGADSSISRTFSASERVIELLSGEAFFEVRHDPLRPFVVLARGLKLRASHTAFGVRMLAGMPLSIFVSHGRLQVAGPTTAARILDANMRLDLPSHAVPQVTKLAPDALERALAWRDGMLSFEGDTLAAAVTQFDRYGPVRFEITDPALARETISGLFAANDPIGFAHAIAPSLNARAEVQGDVVRLSSAPANP
jgi:transmembrane sensor